MKFIAAMQPTFIPWVGYFAMLDTVDEFIFLDDVQFTKPSWQMRNFLRGPDGPVLLSLSVARKPSKPLICNTHLAKNGFEIKIMRTVETLFKTAQFADYAVNVVAEAFATCEDNLSILNCNIIKRISKLVGINTPTHLSTELPVRPSEKSMRLLDLARYFKADCYLSPVGSLDYLRDSNHFETSEVMLQFFNYVHPHYPQGGEEFLSHMSALEALAHIGPGEFLATIRQGVNSPLTMQEVLESAHEKL